MGPANPAPLRPQGLEAGHVTARPADRAAADRADPHFQVLLDDLVGRAEALDRVTQEVQRPAELAGAVETARASLEDALSLGAQLLEAYREAVQRDGDAREMS